jgi:diguanylate cyclase (GGDEF)-like protein
MIGIALAGCLFLTVVYPRTPDLVNTMSILVSVVAARAAWDLWVHTRGDRFATASIAVVVLLSVVATTPVLELLLQGSFASGEMPSDFGLPVAIAGWALGLPLLTVCVLGLEFSQLYATMENAGMYDVLTGLGNRQAIIAEIEGEHSRSHRAKTPFSIAVFGVDNVGNVSDDHGERAGGQLLKWVAETIHKNIRPYDKVGRYSAEEFLLMMPNTTEKEALKIAERARQAIQNRACLVDGRQISATVSVGVAAGERGGDLDSVLSAADQAVSSARDRGRNCTVLAPLLGMEVEGQGAKS